MAFDDQIPVNPEISQEFRSFEEFCSENVGRELTYLNLVEANPLEMDSVTLAFSMRHLLRLSKGLRDLLLKSLNSDPPPEISSILASKGIELDKTQAAALRDIIFSFRDCGDDETSLKFVRALQMMTLARDRPRVALSFGESYSAPDEGWCEDDFGGDQSTLDAVRSIEDPQWIKTEES